MDILIAIVAGFWIGIMTSKFLNRVVKKLNVNKIKDNLQNKDRKVGAFTKEMGGGRSCPPHSWEQLHEDRYGLRCSICEETIQ